MEMPNTRKQFEIELALAFSAGVDSVLKGKVSSEYDGLKKFVKDNELNCQQVFLSSLSACISLQG